MPVLSQNYPEWRQLSPSLPLKQPDLASVGWQGRQRGEMWQKFWKCKVVLYEMKVEADPKQEAP